MSHVFICPLITFRQIYCLLFKDCGGAEVQIRSFVLQTQTHKMFDFARNIRLQPDVVEIEKDEKGHVGIAIGGGAPLCPCLYIVQIFENSPAKKNELLDVGDELVAINGESLKGYEKMAVASLIRETKGSIRISFNRLQLDTDKSPSLDILLKKFKHRLVDTLDDTTADALGLSRAILANDILARLKDRLDKNQQFYTELIKKSEEMIRYYQQLSNTQTSISGTLAEIATKELVGDQLTKSIAGLSTTHKVFGKNHSVLAQKMGDMVKALQLHANAAIPDVKQSLTKYLDGKYEYLSYCLRVKEMEDEEAEMATARERLARMETGNYEYRVMLKSREASRLAFMEKRKQVAVKLGLLDERHVRELAIQLKALIDAMKMSHVNCRDEIQKF